MWNEIIIFLVLEFVLATSVSFWLRGSMNVRKFWVYLDEAIGFIFIFGLIFLISKFGSFDFINALIEFVWASILIIILFVVFIFVVGIEFGNFLESVFRNPKRKK